MEGTSSLHFEIIYQRKKNLEIPILASGKKPENRECGFEVELYEAKNLGRIGKNRKALINITSDESR